MSKSIKLKNDTYIDSTSVSHNRERLSELLPNYVMRNYNNNSAGRLPVQDTRNANYAPSYYWGNGRGVYFEFKSSGVIGVSGYFTCLMTIVGWDDSSGGNIIQLAFPMDSNHNIYSRASSGNESWGSWKVISQV